MSNPFYKQVDPLKLGKILWPEVNFYKEQREIIYSVWENDETVVPAAHMMGKDFVTGFICLVFFLTRTPCRIITTSVDSKQLEGVLWGEIRRFIQTSSIPLEESDGGPLVVNHMHIRQLYPGTKKRVGLSYLIGRVAEKGEGMSGHHIAKSGDGIPRTLFVADEASGVDQETMDKSTEWRHRALLIGNPYDCNNEFKWAVKGRPNSEDRGGDLYRANNDPRPGMVRKVLRIRAEDSPNVKRGMREVNLGLPLSHRVIIPGVLPYEDYLTRRMRWDIIKQTVGLDADFYEGESTLLFPTEWLNISNRRALQLSLREKYQDRGNGSLFLRKAKAGGCDPGEGGDANRLGTAWTIVDELGILEIEERRTTDTSDIVSITKSLIRKWKVDPRYFYFDRGGGGKQIADILRRDGYPVKTIGFGEPPTPDPKLGRTRFNERLDQREDKYAYLSKRGQMYHEFRLAIDPSLATNPEEVFAIPAKYYKLRQELAPIPLLYDRDGRIILPPKHPNKLGVGGGATGMGKIKSLTEIIGHSPDIADSAVLAYHALRVRLGNLGIGGAASGSGKPRIGGMKRRVPVEDLD